MGSSMGKYGGGIGKEGFRRPLRPDARIKPPSYLRRFMRHDWYWGFLKIPGIALGFCVAYMTWSENFSNAALDYGENKDFFDRNRRLSQLKGDADAENLLEKSVMLERAVKGTSESLFSWRYCLERSC